MAANSRPQTALMMRRKLAANGKQEKQVVDTIGRVWAQDLLQSSQFKPEHLRDAGRRYATLYWSRYGACCASTAHYGEFVSKSSSNVIDVDREMTMERLLERRQQALGGYTAAVRQTVDMFCVDGQGDCDPTWLAEISLGLPSYYQEERAELAKLESMIAELAGQKVQARVIREARRKRAALTAGLAAIRHMLIPPMRMEWLNYGLECLAEIDRQEGRHRRGRRRQQRGGAWDGLADTPEDQAA